MPTRSRWLVPSVLVLFNACIDSLPTSPREMRVRGPALSISLATGFYFLPPMVGNPATFSGVFDPNRTPTVRIVCTDASASGCPSVAIFGSGGTEAVKRDAEGESYSVVWHAPSTLTLGAKYRVDVHDGPRLLGSADLWVVAGQQDLKGVGSGYVGVLRGNPFLIKFRIEIDQLGGSPADPASTAIPEVEYQSRAQDFAADYPGLEGMPISFNTVTVVFKPAATVGDVNAIIEALGAQIVGGIPGTPAVSGIMVLRLPTTSHSAFKTALTQLRSNHAVAVAVPDLAARSQMISDGNSQWSWAVDTVGGNEGDGGNWGMEASRVPQLWNLNAAVAKTGRRAEVGVIDQGFSQHDDLPRVSDLTPFGLGRYPDDHGTHVMGIIGALFNNQKGVDGVNPFADLVFRSGPNFFDMTGDSVNVSVTETMLFAVHDIIANRPNVKVINISLGFAWPSSLDVNTSMEAQEMADYCGEIVRQYFRILQETGHQLPIIVSAAGNDNLSLATYATPFNNAALTAPGLAPVIVVEALENSQVSQGASSPEIGIAVYSNTDGHLSAPGSDIRSTWGSSAYHENSGTSMAAPHVAGLISYLYALAPGLSRPTLNSNPVLELLRRSSLPVSGGVRTAPRIDAFAAALEVDREFGSDGVLRTLLDIDDGTLHGNQRTVPGGADYLGDIQTDPGFRDNVVTMTDFRRWRDWLLQIEDPPELILDGSDQHPKKDLNGDGIVSVPELENRYPRGDFNGDGVLSRTRVATMPPAYGSQQLTDLGVMKLLFNDLNYSAADLDNLINSGDVEVDATYCLETPGATAGRSTIRVDGTSNFEDARTHFMNFPRRIYTAETSRGPFRIRAMARNDAGEILSSVERVFPFTLAAYEVWRPVCRVVEMDMNFPASLTGGQQTELRITITLRDPVANRSIVGAGVPVTIITDYTVGQRTGVTGADGVYITYVTAPATGSGAKNVTVESEFWGQFVQEWKRVTWSNPE